MKRNESQWYKEIKTHIKNKKKQQKTITSCWWEKKIHIRNHFDKIVLFICLTFLLRRFCFKWAVGTVNQIFFHWLLFFSSSSFSPRIKLSQHSPHRLNWSGRAKSLKEWEQASELRLNTQKGRITKICVLCNDNIISSQVVSQLELLDKMCIVAFVCETFYLK